MFQTHTKQRITEEQYQTIQRILRDNDMSHIADNIRLSDDETYIVDVAQGLFLVGKTSVASQLMRVFQ